MFNKHTLILLAALIIYPILIHFSLTLRKSSDSEGFCYFARPCVSFCCKNGSADCSESAIRSKFNTSDLFSQHNDFYMFDDYGGEDNDTNSNRYEIYFGEPKCFLTHPDEHQEWKFSSVSEVAAN